MLRYLLALTATGIGLFALIKPVHIDDTVVLHVAENILRDPLRPFAGEFFWLEEPQPLAKVTTNPPLVSYWLAPWIALAGYREWVLHLSFAPFVALLMWGMHRLATRWLGAEWAWWAVGWLMLSPAVLPGMNLMRDVPALALFVGGLACWVEGLERRQARWLIAGALLGGLAGLAKYTALIWLPLVALYTVQRRAYGALGWLTLALCR
jgi:4-amino-4-deoxy-L-arabinose transferase-like glycosyltransferase